VPVTQRSASASFRRLAMRIATLAVAVVVAVIVGSSGGASAATFTAACAGSAGDASSLIAALASANSTAGADTVQLGQGCTYTLTAVDNHWYGPNGLPPITSSITVEGNGSTIERSSAMATPPFRLFYVAADPANPNTFDYIVPAGSSSGGGQLTLRDLTLSGGFAKGGDSDGGGGGGGFGGAIFNQGIVVIEDATLSDNTAQGGSAIDSSAGPSGGGIGSSSTSALAGGFGPGTFAGASGGSGAGGGGGGAGFATGESGTPTANASGGGGGGPATGLGGAGAAGSAGAAGAAGDGSGGGGGSSTGAVVGGGAGGAFGEGAPDSFITTGEAGGGGVGGGGAARSGTGLGAGGGGFGGGGGGSLNGASMINGGKGGFGGGGGSASSNGGTGGPSGFGGGTGTTAGGGGGGGMGGAIFNMQGTLTIRDSTIAGNQAIGGADDVTDSGKAYGGAIFNLSGAVTAVASTISGNTALTGGSGVYSLAYDAATARSAQLTLEDTIVADDTGPDDVFVDTSNYITPANASTSTADLSQFDLVRTSGTFGSSVTGSPLTGDPLLGPLQNNGGQTDTMEPAPSSPVIDAGDALGVSDDQRGEPRPFDFSGLANAPGGDGSDIGAYEWQGCAGQTSPLQACHTVTVVPAGTGAGTVTDSRVISCPSTCTGSYVQGTALSLTATPSTGSVFSGWSGDCTGTADCGVTVDSDKAITATFSQLPPVVATAPAGAVGARTATLSGTVNPLDSATTYQFEYGTTTAYGKSAPPAGAPAGADDADHRESQSVTGLAPGTTYHFRIVATNAGGTTRSRDATFTTIARPELSKLALKPARFRAATATEPKPAGNDRPAVGTTISYRDTSVAKTTFTVRQRISGVRSGKRCAAPHGQVAKGVRRCSLTVTRGSFSHVDKAGRNTVRFTGKLRGRPLSPANYSLVVSASNAAGTSRRLTVRFQVVSRSG
jgi:Divergent InlB B-repeat domain